MRRPLVLIDADDTLWENYRWFVDVVDAWSRRMAAHGIANDRAVAALEECEDRNIPRTGYGAAPFVASLTDAWRALRPDAGAEETREFVAFARWAEASIRAHPIVLLAGVEDALAEMAPHARLVVFTKGRADEQVAKVERSGIAERFEDVTVVREKTPEVYADECARRGASPAQTWMVGNSAHSDVNPARRAGLRTVHVPHPAPWHRDVEPFVSVGPPTLIARSFADVPRLVGIRPV